MIQTRHARLEAFRLAMIRRLHPWPLAARRSSGLDRTVTDPATDPAIETGSVGALHLVELACHELDTLEATVINEVRSAGMTWSDVSRALGDITSADGGMIQLLAGHEALLNQLATSLINEEQQ